jgi:excisionase family DNA binding protein
MRGDGVRQEGATSLVAARRTRGRDDQLLSADEVAEMIGMTTDYVYDLSRRGQIPTITFGRKRRYRRESVVRWLENLEGRSVR